MAAFNPFSPQSYFSSQPPGIKPPQPPRRTTGAPQAGGSLPYPGAPPSGSEFTGPGGLPGYGRQGTQFVPTTGNFLSPAQQNQLAVSQGQTDIATQASQALAAQQIGAQRESQTSAQKFQGGQSAQERQAAMDRLLAEQAAATQAQADAARYGLTSQTQAEQAAAALQASGYQGQQGLQSSAQGAAAYQLRQQIEEARRSQESGQKFQRGSQESSQGAALDQLMRQLDASRQSQESSQGFQSRFLGEQAGFQTAAEQRRLREFQPFFDSLTNELSSTGGGGAGGSIVPEVQQPTAAEDSARAAAFARAKDQAGLIGRSAMTSLQNVMGGRGLTGSGLAVNQAGGVIGEGARQLGEVSREQAIQDLQAARQRASEAYQGGIAQRGQTLSAETARRGQNIQARLGAFSPLMGLITSRAY